MLAFCVVPLLGCVRHGPGPAAAAGSTPDIIRVFLVGLEPRDMGLVTQAVNALTRKELNATVEWTFLGWDRWDQKYVLALASGTPISAIYTATWANYQILAAKGSFMPLDSLLPTDAPLTWKSLTAAQWNDARVGGTIYTVPCDWKEYVTNCITYRADIARSLGITKPIDTIAGLETFMDRARQASPGLIPFAATPDDIMGIEDAFLGSDEKLIQGTVLSYFVVADQAGGLTSWFDSDAFLRYAQTMKRWHDKGYWPADILTSTTTSEDSFREGRNVACVENPGKADALFRVLSGPHPSWDLGAFVFALANGVVHANPSIGNGMALPRGCPDPGTTLAFLDKLHGDSRYYRLTTYGIEGTHYRLDQAGHAVTIPGTGFWYEAMQPWGWHVDRQTIPFSDEWPQYGTINTALEAIATPGRYSTFAFDSTPVAAQVAALTQIAHQYLNPILVGKVPDARAAIRTLLGRLKDAGSRRLHRRAAPPARCLRGAKGLLLKDVSPGTAAAKRFLRVLTALVMAVVLTTVIISTIFSVTFEQIITDQTATLVGANLSQLSGAVSGLNDSVQKIAAQVFFDTTIRKLFLNRAPGDIERGDGLDQLDNYRFTSSAIASLYLFNKTTGTIYVSSDHSANKVQAAADFFDSDLFTLIRTYPYARPLVPIPRRIPLGDAFDSQGQSYGGYTFLYFDSMSPWVSRNLVVINVSQAGISRCSPTSTKPRAAPRWSWTRPGRSIAGSGPFPLLSDLSTEGFVRTLFSAPRGPGFVTVTFNGVRSYLAGAGPDVNGWRYASLTPVDKVTSRSRGLRNRVLAAALAILAVGLIVTLFFSWKLYTPLRSVLARMRSMERENTENRTVVRGELLRKLLEGYESGDDEAVCGLIPLRIGPGDGLVLALVLIDAHGRFLRDHGARERDRMKQDIIRAFLSALPVPFSAESVDMGEDRLVVLVPVRGPRTPEVRGVLLRAFRGAQQAVARQHGLSLTVVVEPGESAGHVSFLYSQAVKDSFYRFFLGQGALITTEMAAEFTGTDFSSQEKKEARLVDALMLGSVGEARERLREIVADISRCSSSTATLALSHLVFTISTAVETLRKNNFPGVPGRRGIRRLAGGLRDRGGNGGRLLGAVRAYGRPHGAPSQDQAREPRGAGDGVRRPGVRQQEPVPEVHCRRAGHERQLPREALPQGDGNIHHGLRGGGPHERGEEAPGRELTDHRGDLRPRGLHERRVLLQGVQARPRRHAGGVPPQRRGRRCPPPPCMRARELTASRSCQARPPWRGR